MRLKSIVLQNFGPYKGRHEVAIPDTGKVAVIGENGAGKSFLFDAIFFALFGQAANRPRTIYELFNDSARQPVKDGLLELAFELNGSDVQVRRLVDSVGRKQMPILIIDGVVVTEGKSDQFAAEIARLGLSEQVFLTSAYASQNGAGHLIGLNDGERRGVFEAVLNLGEYAQAHEQVSAECYLLGVKINEIDGQRAAMLRGLPDRAALLDELTSIEATRLQLVDSANQLAIQLEGKRDELALAKANAQDLTRTQQAIRDLDAANAKDVALAADQAERLKNNEALLARADEIREAVTAVETLNAAIADLEQERDRLQADIKSKHEVHRASLAMAIDRAQSAVTAAEADHKKAAAEIEPLIVEERDLIQRLAGHRLQLPDAQRQASLVDEVPCKSQRLLVNACQLLLDANRARHKVDGLATAIEKDEALLTELRPRLATARDYLQETLNALALARQALSREQDFLMVTPKETEDLEAALADVCNELMAKRTALPSYALKTKHASALDAAEERVTTYKQVIAEAEARVQDRTAQIETLKAQQAAAQDLQATVDRLARESDVLRVEADILQNTLTGLEKQAGGIEATLAQADAAMAQMDGLTSQCIGLKDRLSRLDIVREGLSPKGAPALKVDAAGPEITAIINDLLLACYGPRFTARIDTQKENLTNDNVREVLQVKVIDADNGQVANVEHLSGGEQAIVKEAISLGLAVFARKHCGVDLRCLIRDETTAPLSDDNGERYIQMLDRALSIGGFDQCLYVSHKGSLQNMADVRLRVADGRVTVEA